MEISVTTTITDDGKSFIDELKAKETGGCWKFFPSKAKCITLLSRVIIILFLIGALYGILQKDVLPGSEIFAILLLAICAYSGGCIVGCLKLPPLLGMLTVGILFRNLPFIPYYNNISVMWASTLRDIALVIILLKAGMGLDPKKLLELKFLVLRLSFLPCLIEAASSAVFTHFLIGLPWTWAVMLGFIVSAVSAAVLVPGMLTIEEKGIGLQSGIPTLVMAAVSLDNIVALVGFMVLFNIITSNESLLWTSIKRPLEPCIGFIFGAMSGILMWYLPNENDPKPVVVYSRVLLLCLGGLTFTFVSKSLGISGAGALSCVSLAFIASYKWRKNMENFKTITWITGMLWLMIEPFLFGLIGAEVTIESLQNNLGDGSLALFLGVAVRMLVTVLSLLRSKLNLKEKMFVSGSWLAKATVQAAVGSHALDYARSENKDPLFHEYGKQVLTVSVLSIIITAPLGAAFIDHLGPYLLKRNTHDPTVPEEFSKEENITVVEGTTTNYGSCYQEERKEISLIKNEVSCNSTQHFIRPKV